VPRTPVIEHVCDDSGSCDCQHRMSRAEAARLVEGQSHMWLDEVDEKGVPIHRAIRRLLEPRRLVRLRAHVPGEREIVAAVFGVSAAKHSIENWPLTEDELRNKKEPSC
jgi:hypothetical protein